MSTENKYINTIINGRPVSAPENHSIIQALWYAGYPRIKSVGCLNGVCGSCRVMVRKKNNNVISTELACESLIEEGMQVNFLSFPSSLPHNYKLANIRNSWGVQANFHSIFPEAKSCRHCSGCDISCPMGIEVERGVVLAAKGRFKEAGDLFSECILCDLCQSACPESITPHYVGVFARRVTAYLHLRPSNLINRLERLRKGELKINTDIPSADNDNDNDNE